MNLARIHLNTPASYKETKQLACRHTKGALGRIQLHSEPSQICKGFPEIIYESLTFFGLDDDIVNIHMYIFIYLIMQTFLHTPLVSGTSIS
jgi:hypothetical protein